MGIINSFLSLNYESERLIDPSTSSRGEAKKIHDLILGLLSAHHH